QPADWQLPKIVYPDISESPRFFLDRSGAVVNGDCYWITLHDGQDERWLYLMLAISNSTFIEKFYDCVFHNKLYSGRRRFMTQYVNEFPLPDLECHVSQKIVERLRRLLSAGIDNAVETEINSLVWLAFGLKEE